MIGTDVEFFVAQEGVETIIPALRAFKNAQHGGAKFEKIYKDIAGPDFTGYDSLYMDLETTQVTEDGAAIETPCNPGHSAEELIRHVTPGVLQAIKVAKANYGYLSAQPLVWLERGDLDKRDELRVLGCAPDINYYEQDGRACKPVQNAEKTTWRTGGGHIHFSPDSVHLPDVQDRLVVFSDLLLGTLDVMLEHTDEAKKRRTMYGQAGKHRVQPWGIEYRAMTSTWFVNPVLAQAVLEVASLVHDVAEQGLEPWRIMDRVGWRNVVRGINDCDKQFCSKVFLYTIDCLSKLDVDVRGLPFDLFRQIYRNGGVINTYGYNMKGWEV